MNRKKWDWELRSELEMAANIKGFLIGILIALLFGLVHVLYFMWMM